MSGMINWAGNANLLWNSSDANQELQQKGKEDQPEDSDPKRGASLESPKTTAKSNYEVLEADPKDRSDSRQPKRRW